MISATVLPVDSRFAAFLAVAALLILTPGPDTALVVRNALRSGRRAASVTALGVGVGTLWWATAAVLGIAVILETSAIAFTVLKLAGAAYLAYLGLRSLLASLPGRKGEAGHAAAERASTPLPDRAAFRQGVLSNLFNPKTGAFFVTVIPQFVSLGDPPARLLLMLVAYETLLLVWLNLYGYAVDRAGRSRLGSRLREGLSRATGVVLIALGVRLALERR